MCALVRIILAVSALSAFSAHAAGAIDRRASGTSQPGFAWAATTPDVPLIHTAQITGSTSAQKIEGDSAAQTRRAIGNLRELLRTSASDLDQVVKLNVYVMEDVEHDAVATTIGAAFRDHPVPVSFVRTRLVQPNALVALDAIAQSKAGGDLPRAASVSTLAAAPCGAHFGVMPAGRRVYLSGYASRTKGFGEGLSEVFALQAKTLAHHGMSAADVVQVKVWFAPLEGLAALKAALSEFFGDLPMPPVVLIEWAGTNANEIEFIVCGNGADSSRFVGPLAFSTRPGAEAPTRFSHIGFIEAGQSLIFTAGFFGHAGESPRQQLQDIFAQLGRTLFDAGSGFRYIAKATYYFTDVEARDVLGDIRDVFYDPARPPAASGVMVRGVGSPGCSTTLDVIAVPLPKR